MLMRKILHKSSFQHGCEEEEERQTENEIQSVSTRLVRDHIDEMHSLFMTFQTATCTGNRHDSDVLWLFAAKSRMSSLHQLYNVDSRFRAVTERLASRLPKIYFSTGGEVCAKYGAVSSLRRFGQSSSVVLAVKEIISNTKWANAWLNLKSCFQHGWFIIINIFWRKTVAN